MTEEESRECIGYDLRKHPCPIGHATLPDAEYCGMESVCMPKGAFDKAKFCFACVGHPQAHVNGDATPKE